MVLGGIVKGGRNPVKIRAQWPIVIPGQRFLCLHFLAFRQHGPRHCSESLGRQLRKHSIIPRALLSYSCLSKTPARVMWLNSCVTGKKECFITLLQASKSFSSNLGGRGEVRFLQGQPSRQKWLRPQQGAEVRRCPEQLRG